MEIFLARLPRLHPQKDYIESQLNNIKTGDRGENKVLRALEEVQFEDESLLIRNFVVQIHPKRVIQIDYLLVTRKYILIIEVKNIAGHIEFISIPPQIIRTMSDKPPQAFDCPFTQLDRNLDGFQKLLLTIQLPVYSCLVWANTFTTFKLPFEPSHSFLSLKRIPLFIQQLEISPPSLSVAQFQALKKALISKTTRFQEQSFCKRYQVDEKDLLVGLYCPQCHSLLKKFVRTWICKGCNTKAQNLIEANILSQFYIRGPELTIAQIHKELPLLGTKKIREVLISSGYTPSGKTNARIYKKRTELEDLQ